MNEEVLLEMEFFRLAQYLTKLSNTITSDELFKYIQKINFSKQKLTQTLSYYKELARTNPPLPTWRLTNQRNRWESNGPELRYKLLDVEKRMTLLIPWRIFKIYTMKTERTFRVGENYWLLDHFVDRIMINWKVELATGQGRV